jgi:uncharacterized protein (TIGR02996 family)
MALYVKVVKIPMLNLEAPIIPGISAAGIRIGQPVETILAVLQPLEVVPLDGCQRLRFGAVDLWVKQRLVDQIGIYKGYRGTIAGKIGIGSILQEVEAAFGSVLEDEEDNLVVAGMPGWCFETETWISGREPAQNPDAAVTGIFVFGDGRTSSRSDDQAFLDAIRANPGDDALRLVYADWLEERGDPRGEFLRLESALAKIRADDESHGTLKARWSALRVGLDTAWLTALNRFPRSISVLSVENTSVPNLFALQVDVDGEKKTYRVERLSSHMGIEQEFFFLLSDRACAEHQNSAKYHIELWWLFQHIAAGDRVDFPAVFGKITPPASRKWWQFWR